MSLHSGEVSIKVFPFKVEQYFILVWVVYVCSWIHFWGVYSAILFFGHVLWIMHRFKRSWPNIYCKVLQTSVDQLLWQNKYIIVTHNLWSFKCVNLLCHCVRNREDRRDKWSTHTWMETVWSTTWRTPACSTSAHPKYLQYSFHFPPECHIMTHTYLTTSINYENFSG